MKLQLVLSLLLGKSIFLLTQILKLGGGSAAPGLYALKIYPNLISDLSQDIPETVLITGTNGKTTTSRILFQLAKDQNKMVIRNHTGSNLERGIASALIKSFTLKEILSGSYKQKYDLAIWELDEAAFTLLAGKLNPKLIVILNLFRDQLDRYGEVDAVLNNWCNVLKNISPSCKLLINGDDQILYSLKSCFEGQVSTFGVEGNKIKGEKVINSIHNSKLDYKAEKIDLLGLNGSNFVFTNNKITQKEFVQIPGLYHIYDFIAALSAAHILRIDISGAPQTLAHFSPAFGRMEKISLDGKTGLILLIKNPTGTSEVLSTISAELQNGDTLLMALNDNLADGTDVSWIWDAQFETLNSPHLPSKIYISGTRAEDLALRLKYAGIPSDSIQIQKDIDTAFNTARQNTNNRLFILPTYTALITLQKILKKNHIKEEYWKD